MSRLLPVCALRWRLPALAVVFASSIAHAGSFAEDGSFVPAADAVFRFGFDEVPAEIAGLTLAADGSSALEGSTYGVIDSQEEYTQIPLTLPPGSYVLRFFARHNRIVGGLNATYATTEDDPGNPGFYATAYPTGVVTSDGWYELATAPVVFDPTRAVNVGIFLYGSGADIDALEVVPAALPAAALKTCEKAYDPVCDANEFCSAGFCRNGDLMVPPLPADPSELVTYLQSRLDMFFGGRFTRAERLPAARAVLEGLRAASSGWQLWNGFATALHKLQDWHTSIAGPVDVEGRGAFPICFVEGSADVSQVAAPSDASLPDVIVSHVNPDPEASSQLGPGDRLVAVDGVHPIAWMDSLDAVDWSYWHANDPNVHAEAVERLRLAIRRYAKELTFVRCDRETGTCASTTETLAIRALPRTEPQLYPECDHRPIYPVVGENINSTSHRVRGRVVGRVEGTSEEEAIHGMVWNGVNAQGGNPFAEALAQLTTGAKGVLLDHRTGNGGTEYAAELLTQPFRAPALIGASSSFNLTLGLFDDPFDGLSLFNLRKDLGQDGYNVGSEEYHPELKTALLLARDGSASDWFPLGMKGAPNIRLFGRTTAGAFSSFFQFDYYGGLSWQLASGDFVEADGATRIGHGVEPDEVLLQKQSDLLRGRDTVVTRALEWLREETQP